MQCVDGGSSSGVGDRDIDQLLASAQQYMNAGDLAMAKEVCHEIMKREPSHPEAYNRLGIIAFLEEHYAVALEFIKTAIQFNDQIADYHFNLFLCDFKLNDFVDAEAALRKTIDLAPEHLEANMQLGLLLSAQGQFDEAAPFYEKVLMIGPLENAEAHARLGEAYLHLDRRDLALTEANTAHNLDGDNQMALQVIFALLMIENKPEEALDYGERLIKLDPQNGEFRKNLDIAYKQIAAQEML